MLTKFFSYCWLTSLLLFMRPVHSEPVVIAIGEVYQSKTLNEVVGFTLVDDLKQIYNKLGINVEFAYLPNERAIRAVSEGRYQGLDLRISNLANDANMLKVDVPLYYISIYVYGFEGQFYNRLEEVSGKILVSQLGMRFVDKVKDYKRLFLVENAEQAALMVSKGRADLWLAPEAVYDVLKSKYPDIKPVSSAVLYEPLYHYIHISNRHLLPQLEQAVRELVADRQKKQLPL
ncbi:MULTISPECIES: substrate-binding periplasmic protein [Vibrio]|uniref:substrate-binding periplasmic protein n=1 Tax=Vibrio TaxID=662 RepID=UPI002075307C|nr:MULTISPECIES: transporter substrate-binding domain-containing protein [Vibrio]USD35297.1 transporter substrate-binding domain-containing protein [Vibrio sp. SCSIO 43186]USD48364.1 transporter substrate-binding domain-containing protein [Vibrio sp. SCSIO 43145]USD72422.1 transporter substrate-binding domain-containing protein [Vibrio sp. SCSIO 43139]USD98100.1 hypothetical protein CTT30_18825 [Vibrio coralliilyticus]